MCLLYTLSKIPQLPGSPSLHCESMEILSVFNNTLLPSCEICERSRLNIMTERYKYWNWCRCIQRKDSAGVILTASWLNYINIGYGFHISTVCHSCCNNVMYISKENLDISGSAWKNIILIWDSCCPSTEIIYTGRELCSPHASISSQITARFWHIIYDIYCYLYYISMIVINVYNN